MKKWNAVINVIMGAFMGVFLGRTGYVIWNFKTHPERFAMQSAPWYTSIWVDGIFTLAILAVCILVKLILRSVAKKKDFQSGE